MFPQWAGWPSTTAEILSVVGAGNTQAYEMLGRLRTLLPSLLRAPGRPSVSTTDRDVRWSIAACVRDYLMSHPGSVCGDGPRRAYSDDFRRFIVCLDGADRMSVADLSEATGVPTGTLKDWFGVRAVAGEEPVAESGLSDPVETPSICSLWMCLIGRLWPSWHGSFSAFCNMLRTEHRLPCGDTLIGDALQLLGLRDRRRRQPVEAPWSSNTFRALFPGVQWLGDGTDIAIRWGDETFTFNLEAVMDVASNAVVGFTVSDTENEAAVRQAYLCGVQTTGGSPMALTLDNKPCNHTPSLQAALSETIFLRATPARGQAKAPLEGGFGLFAQALPALAVSGGTPREMARQALHLVLTAWFRGRNGRRRTKFNGRTPAQVYASARFTQEELRAALRWLEYLKRREQAMRQTREARLDPVRLTLLKQGLAELGIPDEDGRLAASLACYARDAIVYGIAVFKSKQELGTVPEGADAGRYLGGIIRQHHTKLELQQFSEHILGQRIRMNDVSLHHLKRTAEQLSASTAPLLLPQACVDRALSANFEVDFRFWAQAASVAMAALPWYQSEAQYRSLSRRIAASFKTDRGRRAELIDRLAAPAVPP